ncbi:MAG: type II toxin-antitoxin system HicA family toxin [Spirochaetes bacterium]|nr:type II toxin-antitoxin system HicA family toxin [Candidatus Atribacteria bacterium]MCX7039597.1 type II toxin-antitoxin system HicA family toxin [Spirochaetota bacterium]
MPSSGAEVLKLYLKAGWVVIHRKGSHVKIGKGPLRETIPLHRELGMGLQRKLLKRLEETRRDSGEDQ